MVRQTNIKESYKLYREDSKVVHLKDYMYITTGLMKFIMCKVLNGNDVELGANKSLGTIGIRGKKMKISLDEQGNIIGTKVDWGATYKLWNSDPIAKASNHRIYHMNDHSNGMVYHYYWWGEGMQSMNKRVYSLKFSKDNQRTLAKYIKEGFEYLIKVEKHYNGKEIKIN